MWIFKLFYDKMDRRYYTHYIISNIVVCGLSKNEFSLKYKFEGFFRTDIPNKCSESLKYSPETSTLNC